MISSKNHISVLFFCNNICPVLITSQVRLSLGLINNYWRKANPSFEIMQPFQRDGPWSHYVTANVKFPMETEWRGKEWAGAVNVASENRPYVVRGVRVHEQSMNKCTPHRPASVLSSFFFLFCVPLVSLSLSLSFYITDYHCGAEIPSLTSAGAHNENKWAGSKYAGYVLFAALYQSVHRLSSKMKMDWVTKGP